MLRIITILAFNLEGKASRDRARPQPASQRGFAQPQPEKSNEDRLSSAHEYKKKLHAMVMHKTFEPLSAERPTPQAGAPLDRT